MQPLSPVQLPLSGTVSILSKENQEYISKILNGKELLQTLKQIQRSPSLMEILARYQTKHYVQYDDDCEKYFETYFRLKLSVLSKKFRIETQKFQLFLAYKI